MGLAYQNIIHVIWGFAFALLGIIIVATILNIIFEILKKIVNCLLCGICDHEQRQNDEIDVL